MRKSRRNSDETKKTNFIEHPSGIPDKILIEKELNSIENQWEIPDGLPIETKKIDFHRGPWAIQRK